MVKVTQAHYSPCGCDPYPCPMRAAAACAAALLALLAGIADGLGAAAPQGGGSLKETDAEKLIEKLANTKGSEQYLQRYAIVDELVGMGKKAVPALTKALQRTDLPLLDKGNNRFHIAVALARIGPDAGDAVPALIQTLRHPDWVVREGAAEALGGIGPAAQEAVPHLIKALQDPEARVRKEAASALGAIRARPKESSRALVELLGDNTSLDWSLPNVSSFACEALICIGTPAVPALIDGLGHSNSSVRGGCAAALGEIYPPPKAAVPSLIRALGDADRGVRDIAISALGKLGPVANEAVPALIAQATDEEGRCDYELETALREVGMTPHQAAAGLVATLESPKLERSTTDQQRSDQHQLVLFLSQAAEAEEGVVGALAKALTHRDARVRELAASAIGWIASHDRRPAPALAGAVLPLTRAVSDEAQHVRCAACRALGQIGPQAREAVPTLIRAVETREQRVASYAAEALGRIGPEAKGAVPALVPMLEAAGPEGDFTAAQALGRIGPGATAAVPALTKATKGGKMWTRAAAAEALWRISGRAELAVNALVAMLAEEDPTHKHGHVIHVLREMGPEGAGAAPSLLKLLARSDLWDCWEAPEALARMGAAGREGVRFLAARLQDEKPEVREEAAYALAAFGPAASDAVPQLARALEDQRGVVVEYSAMTLGKIGPAAVGAVPPLARTLRHPFRDARWTAARALGCIGPGARSALPALLDALRDPEEGVRSNVVEALPRISPNDPAVVRVLIGVLREDRHMWVIRDAATALGEIGPAAREAIPALEQYLPSRDREMRAAATAALGKIRGGR